MGAGRTEAAGLAMSANLRDAHCCPVPRIANGMTDPRVASAYPSREAKASSRQHAELAAKDPHQAKPEGLLRA